MRLVERKFMISLLSANLLVFSIVKLDHILQKILITNYYRIQSQVKNLIRTLEQRYIEPRARSQFSGITVFLSKG